MSAMEVWLEVRVGADVVRPTVLSQRQGPCGGWVPYSLSSNICSRDQVLVQLLAGYMEYFLFNTCILSGSLDRASA